MFMIILETIERMSQCAMQQPARAKVPPTNTGTRAYTTQRENLNDGAIA